MQYAFIMSLDPKAIYSKQNQLCCKPWGPTTSSNAVTDSVMHKITRCNKKQQGLIRIIIKM